MEWVFFQTIPDNNHVRRNMIELGYFGKSIAFFYPVQDEAVFVRSFSPGDPSGRSLIGDGVIRNSQISTIGQFTAVQIVYFEDGCFVDIIFFADFRKRISFSNFVGLVVSADDTMQAREIFLGNISLLLREFLLRIELY